MIIEISGVIIIMEYIALLRGVNAGGNRKVDMKKLKMLFESLGHINVSTYINSGNVFFESKYKHNIIREKVENELEKEFGFTIPTLIKTKQEIKTIATAIPAEWKNNSEQRTDVAYLFPEVNTKNILNKLPFKKELIEVRYIKGAIYWNLDRININKSHLSQLVSHEVYQFMTIRNVNTARYLAEK